MNIYETDRKLQEILDRCHAQYQCECKVPGCTINHPSCAVYHADQSLPPGNIGCDGSCVVNSGTLVPNKTRSEEEIRKKAKEMFDTYGMNDGHYLALMWVLGEE
jgi:hypothetical protein